MQPIQVRCPVCQYAQRQFDVTDITGHTEIEIKCRGANCGALLKITLSDTEPYVAVEDITSKKRQYPSRRK